MPRTPGTPLILVLAGLAFSGCAGVISHPCATHSLAEKKNLLSGSFDSRSISVSGRSWFVYVSKDSHDEHGPPVLLLHEMPALSGDILDLGLRLKKEGFTVYIPLLFGKATDDPSHDPTLFIRRAISLSNDPDWLVSNGSVKRPIVDQVATLCREYILPRHKGQRLGVIGNCVTGSIPIALLSRSLARLDAPVVSQPAIPFPAWSPGAKSAIGLSPGELEAAQNRVRENHIEILGFRFQDDRISPARRFEAIDKAFTIDGERHFIDRTVPRREYVGEDGLKKQSHSVLAGCYRPHPGPPNARPSSTEVAWIRLKNFLHIKLDGPAPRPYIEEFPDRLTH